MNTENNKLIAEFMGYDFMSRNIFLNRLPKDFLKNSDNYKCFHNSFDWLMDVVEKIESLGYWTETISGGHTTFKIGKSGDLRLITFKDSENKIEAVYNACLEFIEWYNHQK